VLGLLKSLLRFFRLSEGLAAVGRELATHREVRSEEESFERDEGVKALKGGGGEGSGEEVWCFDDDGPSPLGGGVSDSLLFSSLFEEWFVGCCCPSCFEG